MSGHVSAVTLPKAWFIACRSDELRGDGVLARTIQETPLVLFRGAGGAPSAFVDRCPHRNAPLSLGRKKGAELECGYHGWRFDGQGRCVAIPGLCEGEPDAKARRAVTHAARELDGYVWVWASAGEAPAAEPYRFPSIAAPGYTTVRREFTVTGTVHAVAENALDVPHTAFLHGGLFRTAKKEHEIEVVVRRGLDRVEAEYLGEPRPPGLAARILAPGGGVVRHWDRFLLPSIAQVEYRLGEGSHLVITSALTPIAPFETRLFAAVTFRTPIPGFLVKAALTPVAERIFRQDSAILARQTETIRKFEGEQYANTDIDVLGQQIWRLLKQAADGSEPESPREYRSKMRV